MKKSYSYNLIVLCLILISLVATSCAPAATPTAEQPPTVEPAPVATATTAPPSMPIPTLADVGVPASYEEIQTISPDELKELIEGGADIVVVDNQPASVYDMEHIKGAISFPWAMEITDPGDLPKDKLLILYCACMHEEDAGDVAMKLITQFGYEKIMLLEGGWIKWVELGYPTDK
jgi:rhodanese-related sulfurtransferase